MIWYPSADLITVGYAKPWRNSALHPVRSRRIKASDIAVDAVEKRLVIFGAAWIVFALIRSATWLVIARDEFHLAVIAQNLKTMALRLFGPPPQNSAGGKILARISRDVLLSNCVDLVWAVQFGTSSQCAGLHQNAIGRNCAARCYRLGTISPLLNWVGGG